jgi:hypothetical protein
MMISSGKPEKIESYKLWPAVMGVVSDSGKAGSQAENKRSREHQDKLA